MKQAREQGFALPSVIVASLVMFTVLVALVGSVTSVKSALDNQYYDGLASDAAESGLIQAKKCAFDSTLTTSVTVYANTNCAGVVQSGQARYLVDRTDSAKYASNRYRSFYSVNLLSLDAKGRLLQVTGTVQTFRTSDTSLTAPIRTVTKVMKLQIINKPDPFGDRASRRFWYFGANAGLDFGASGSDLPTPVRLQNPQVSSTQPLIGHEGVTTVSDQNGALQFTSNGLQIWDRTGAYMADSTGMYGSSSAVQAVASFPLKNDRSAYAVISTTGQGEDGLGELYMNQITLTNDVAGNNGNGRMISKNKQLGAGQNLSPALPAAMAAGSKANGNPINPGSRTDMSYAGESLNAAPLLDGTGYVVYTYNQRTGKVVMFTIKDGKEVGLAQQTALTFPSDDSSRAGGTGCATQSNANGNWDVGSYASINFSSDYSQMLLATGAWCGSTDDRGGSLFLFNVSPLTGALTQTASWTFHGEIAWQGGNSSRHGIYSADISPAGKYVYVTQAYSAYLFRYNITKQTTADIEASRWKIGALTTLGGATTGGNAAVWAGGGQIRRGPDGRMYMADRGYYQMYTDAIGGPGNGPVSGNNYLSYINYPDADWQTPAAIGLNLDALLMPSGTSTIWGLPQVATVYTPQMYVY